MFLFQTVTEKTILSGSENLVSNCFKEGTVNSEAKQGVRQIIQKYGISKWHKNAEKAHFGFEEILHKYYPKSSTLPITAQKQSLSLHIPQLKEHTKESIKSVKDKAKSAAIDLNVATKKAQL